ncbi:MAG: DUF1772 domain-containing protein [Winogradskyella sp.]|uniref:anthrone oxygenase family protein n=1 Tax=Winogradskyella sp. TaxID=1883156 RepID=UPI0025E8C4DC|nr:DUF1772 domain-containing protein [Winogradskyella sp.]NRB61405.1 DUF1772 domain-containing protein [Winogradskyella sp.]
MEINYKIIVLILSILFTGLTAGLCFTWFNAVTPGIGRLDNLSFLKAFQAMNRAIINSQFMIIFMGPTILLFVNAVLFRTNNTTFWLFLIAAIIFFIGIGLLTVFGNVPLNEMLDNSNLESLSKLELQTLRNKFENPWNRWHTLRTASSITSFSLLIVGTLYLK